jgi:hypothetical protein
MIKRFIVTCILITIYFVLPKSLVFAHSGGTDAYGCHNCYTSACYGEYHCHNGGGGYIPSGPTYLFPKPENPTNGNWTYSISSDNWCNYDLEMTWDKPLNGDRYSIAPSKYAGANPGPLVDTSSPYFTMKNLTPGRWYVNIKTGNAERWSGVSYWTVDLPKPTPGISAFITKEGSNQYLSYDISCLKTVEGPNEFIDYLKSSNNSPKGKVLLSYNYPTTITVKGLDYKKKEYVQNLSYFPLPTSTPTVNNNSSDDGTGWFFPLIIGGSGMWWFISWIKKNQTES